MRTIISVLIFVILSIPVISGEVTKTFHFSDYTVSNVGEYQLIGFDGCMNTAESGEPSMPWFAVKLLLPPGEKVVSVSISGQKEVIIPGTFMIYPQQESRPLSEEGSGTFKIVQAIYNSDAVYPVKMKGDVSTQYMNGHGIALLSICPLKYNPSKGSLSYYEDIRVTVNTEKDERSSEALNMLSSSKSAMDRVSGFVQNPEMISSYPLKSNKSAPYQILIITPEAFENEFQDLINLYMYRGLVAEVTTVEDISMTINGQDLQEKIRNYIIQEYQNSSIEYVLLGGDVEHVPYRGFYCYVQSGSGYEDNNIPADLYYNALDGTWNDDGDNHWGEIGEDDLLPELAVGRFSFSSQNELDAMLNKTISYQDNPVLGEFEHPILAGEYLYDNPQTWGSDYLRLLIGYHEDNGYTTNGIPTTHVIDSLYELHGYWGTSTILDRINQGRSFIHHAGHANSTYVMHLMNSDITNANFSQVNGSTHNYTLFQSHGCICGAFDESDCIMERMVAIDNFAVAVIGNSRYGWFNEGQTEGPAAHLHREMLDAMYNEKMGHIGQAFMECKIQTAPWVTAPGQHEEGALRWNFYDINILGDPALQIWCDEPFVADAIFDSPILVGAPTFDVTVLSNNVPVEGLSCTLTRNGVMHGTGQTDASGQTTITIDPPFTSVGNAQLTITGYNCQKRTYSIAVAPSGLPYIIYHDHEIDDMIGGNANGLPDFGETNLMTINLENAGTADAINVSATVSTSSEYIELTDTEGYYGDMTAGSIMGTTNDYAFDISDAVPDQEIVEFLVNITGDDKESWLDEFSIVLNAPVLESGVMIIDDQIGGNGNGFLDPGEIANISFGALNTGHATAPGAMASLEVISPWVSISGSSAVEIGDMVPGVNESATFEVQVDEDTPLGSNVQFVFSVSSGAYGFTDDFFTSAGVLVEDWESGDFTAFHWQFDGNVPWTINSSEAYEGVYCAKSGDIVDGQQSELFLYIDVLADGDISFYRKVSSEAEWDFLRFYIDYDMLGEWSGELNWEIVSYPVSQGLHTFRWVYEKDGYLSNGDDCAWIDYIVFPPVDIATGINDNDQVPGLTFNLWPNPASSLLHLDYTVDRTTEVEIAVFDLLGHKIAEYENGQIRSKGHYSREIDVSGFKSGIYLCCIKTSAGIQTKKLVVK